MVERVERRWRLIADGFERREEEWKELEIGEGWGLVENGEDARKRWGYKDGKKVRSGSCKKLREEFCSSRI